MTNNISLFPYYNKFGQDGLFSIGNYSFDYLRDGGTYPLKNNGDEELKQIIFIDALGYWTHDEYGFNITRTIIVKNANRLYGKNGYACKTAQIGLALQWTSQTSCQRGIVPVGIVENVGLRQNFELKHSFSKAKFRGNVQLTLIMYIATTGKPANDELHLANKSGMIIGELDTWEISFDGVGSDFPIFEVSLPGEPLWEVKCEWDDATNDLFNDEHVAIYINRAHEAFKFIDRESKTYIPQLLVETLGNAIESVVETLRADDNLRCLDKAQEGSIAQAMLYFRDNLGWDLTTPPSCSKSIRHYLERKLKI